MFVNNLVLTQALGVCPFINSSRNLDSAVGMGFAVTFVSTLSSLVTWALYRGVLVPLGIAYLKTVVFVLVVAGLVRILELTVQRISTTLNETLGAYLPLVTTNCAVLGITLIAVKNDYNVLQSFTAGFAGGAGFLLASILLSSLRDALRRERVPKSFQGYPIAFISAGLMALAFMALDKALLRNLIG